MGDVFAKAVRCADTYTDQGKPAAWLFTIARTVLIDHLRVRRPRTVSLGAAPETAAPAPAEAHHVELRMAIESALARLTPVQRDVIVWRFLEGASTRETAAQVGRTEEAVKKLQQRALTQLRRQLAAA